MAKAPWARLTNPISPMVTDSPTETMNSTVPAASPPNRMLAKSAAKSTGDPVPPGGANWRSGERRIGDILFASRRHSRQAVRRGPDRQRLPMRSPITSSARTGRSPASLHWSFTSGTVTSTFSCSLPSEPFTTSSRYSFMTMSRVCGSIMIGPCGLLNFQPSSDFTAASPSHLALGGLQRRER